MLKLLRRSVLVGCAAVGALAFTSTANADLLGYYSANSPNDDFILANDLGDSDLDGEIFGDVAFTDDAGGHTGAAGDHALEFNGVTEDFATVEVFGEFEEATLAVWVKGVPTGDWSGIFQARGAGPPLGMGYNAGSGNLTYTWNDNSGDTWNFGGSQPDLFVPEDEWTLVALSLNPDSATLFVGEKGGELFQATNEIPHLAQTNEVGFTLGKDNCCGTERNFLGFMDDAAIWDHALLPQEIAQIHSGEKVVTDFTERSGGLRQVPVAGGSIGVDALSGSLSDVTFGAPQERSGLAQYWFEGNVRGNTEFFLENGETGTEENPLVTANPFASDTTWWVGPQNQDVISDQPLPAYPAGLAGTRFDGASGADNYGVRLTGEIFITADGEYLIRDGIDDFTMVAIDQDGNGELDDLDSIVPEDVGTLFPGDPIGDVLILDDSWANVDGSNQQEDFHGIAEIENISGDGEWRKIEMWMSEGGGGDAGILYMGSLDDEDIFDETVGEALTQEARDKFVVRNENLRSTVSSIESASASAALADNVEFVIQTGADGTSDQFSVDDADGLYATTLDVTGANILVDAAEGIADGTAFTIFDADTIVGADTVTINAEGFDLSRIGEGVIVFGSGCNPNTMGDIDGSGDVGFADFLILSDNFGNDVGGHAQGDLDCNGKVEFADFLVLSNNFGNAVGAEASSVPEPSGLALFGLAGIFVGLLRRRRS